MSPVVSVLVANYNGGAFVADALHSAAQQTLKAIEILFVDDASTDDSLAIARDFSRRDSRVRIIALPRNSGPGAARNAGIEAARGRWFAILDSDDFMHPGRLRAMLDEIEVSQAHICADDLLIFQDGAAPKSFASGTGRTPRWISAPEFVLSNQIFSSRPALGYLKPLIDLDFLRRHGIRYDPALRIGEDYDLIVKLLAHGARYRLLGSLGYFYRKHTSSTSHRITSGEIDQLLRADEVSAKLFERPDPELHRAQDARRRSLERARAFSDLVSALKARTWPEATRIAIRGPYAALLLWMPVAARLKRMWPASREKTRVAGAQKRACLISRQRIVGSTNGSSAYVLSICNALRDHRYAITLISPSPATFGRWPFLYLRPEMDVFDEIFVRGSIRIGRRLFLARNPLVLLTALLTLLERLLIRLRVLRHARVKAAPYAIGAPWTREDQLFIARHAPSKSDLVIADYAFSTPAISYALSPRARNFVVMHDLFSSRASQFDSVGSADSVASLDEASEIALLGQAEAIVAIQWKEAKFVASRLAEKRVIVAPMSVATLDKPQAGRDDTILFVGSNTAPNVIGLRWFLASVWPSVKTRVPDCILRVAGTVGQSVTERTEGVEFLGLVPDLAPEYSGAGVVISPLTVGSGLKIKLIEAMGQGKAVVATTSTVDGVEHIVDGAVVVADSPRDFADAIVRILQNKVLRSEMSRKALDTAREHFSPEACYAEIIAFADDRAQSAGPVVHGDQKSRSR